MSGGVTGDTQRDGWLLIREQLMVQRRNIAQLTDGMPADVAQEYLADIDDALSEVGRLEARQREQEQTIRRYANSIVAHHAMHNLSEEAIRESIGGPCQICAKANLSGVSGDGREEKSGKHPFGEPDPVSGSAEQNEQEEQAGVDQPATAPQDEIDLCTCGHDRHWHERTSSRETVCRQTLCVCRDFTLAAVGRSASASTGAPAATQEAAPK